MVVVLRLDNKGFLLIEALISLLIISLLIILLLAMYQTEKRIDTYEQEVFPNEWVYVIRDANSPND